MGQSSEFLGQHGSLEAGGHRKPPSVQGTKGAVVLFQGAVHTACIKRQLIMPSKMQQAARSK